MSSIRNAVGDTRFYSGATKNHLSATHAGPTMQGTAFNDTFWGDSSVRTQMVGGAGDDIYHLYSSLNTVSETAGGGVDSIETWMSYTLPANVENLTVTGDGRYAFGNALDNIIQGGAGSQTLDGGLGNDVLSGGAGSDIFLINKGFGTDLILDFSSDDVVRLAGLGFTSFDAVKAAMTDTGNDLHLAFGDGQGLVLANTDLADLSASQFELGIDMSKLSLSFSDDFNQLSLWDGAGGTWESNYWWGGASGNSLEGNGEQQWYIDTDYGPTKGVNPFSVANGVLTITAAPASEATQAAIGGYEFTSGMLTSYESFSQTYGYFEIRADMPEDKGMWPAFWLLPQDGSWPPELDVIEMYGKDPNSLYMTAHSNASGKQTSDLTVGHVMDTSGFHTYGVLWEEDEITWYFDGMAIANTETPADMHEPMYMLVNLAVGGLAGDPAADFDGDTIKIDYIKAYALEDDGLTLA